ncbi:MAG: ATP phosphoribosyltransferase regulatory subunit [Anaerolineae bacterium]
MTDIFSDLAEVPLPDVAERQVALHRLQSRLHRFGYDLVDTPLVEPAEPFLIKAGDAAISRLVTFDLPGRTLCLRPEFTVPAARLYIQRFQDQPGPVRLQFTGPILQYESLSHNRILQQTALGAELINEYSAAADAEVIALAGKVLQDAGAVSWRLSIGHSGLIGRFLDRYELNRQMRRFVLEWLPALRNGPEGLARALQALDGLRETTGAPPFTPLEDLPDAEAALQAMLQAAPQRGPTAGRSREEIVRRLLSKQQQAEQHHKALTALQDFQHILRHARTPSMLLEHIDNTPMKHVAEELAETFELLSAYGVPGERTSFDISFTRNLDYYTGIVFEYRTPPEAGHTLLAGGGRYDELIRLLGAKHDVPAVGFMIYIDRLLPPEPTVPEALRTEKTHVLIWAAEQKETIDLIAVASALRAEGFTVTTCFHPQASAYAQAQRSRYSHTLSLESPDVLILYAKTSKKPLRIPRRDLSALCQALESKE